MEYIIRIRLILIPGNWARILIKRSDPPARWCLSLVSRFKKDFRKGECGRVLGLDDGVLEFRIYFLNRWRQYKLEEILPEMCDDF